jgi:hypothetical protein
VITIDRNAQQNMILIKRTALNLLSIAKPTINPKNYRKCTVWNPNYLADPMRGTA